MRKANFEAAILDLDGVVTRTASLHARAWKEMFDDFLERRAERHEGDSSAFDIDRDYLRYVDGKPRLDGLRSFLDSRGIRLPEGENDDCAEADTVRGLGKRKNEIFLDLLERKEVETFPDAIEQVRRWKHGGVRTALITSSRNGRRILAAAGIQDLFEVIVDGNDAERIGLRGKPAPDIFLHAARALDVEPQRAIIAEDAIAGVEAGRAGGFGLVVGVARNGGEALRDAGADVVVNDLRQIEDEWEAVLAGSGSNPEHALARLNHIWERLDGKRLALCLDYDGTLTPIVRRPEEATLSSEMRWLLRDLARCATVAIISGRDLTDVRRMVGLDELYYGGSHGYDVAGPAGLRMQQQQAQEYLPELDAAEQELRHRLQGVEGAWVERKRFAIAVHFREANAAEEDGIERIADEVRDAHPRLRTKGGKKIVELQPDVPWDKGRAVRWLLEQLGLAGPGVLPVYVGDDVTDEDAFAALAEQGIGIRIGSPTEPTRAGFYLRDTDELEQFGRELLKRLRRQGEVDG